MKAILIDDEILNIKSLQHDLAGYCPEVQVIGTANTMESGLEAILKLKPDMVFLDIQLHDKTAFDLLPHIDTNNIHVILVTAYNQYGIQGIKNGVVDYLLKPINVLELVAAVRKVTEKRQKLSPDHLLNKEFIQVPFKGHVELVKFSDIIHLEAMGAYTHIFLAGNKKIVSSKSMHNMESILPTTDFVRVHHSYIINIHAIDKIIRSKYGSLLMQNNIEIPISASKRKYVAEVLGL
jgi:two-component system, LytTR family, response regulator